MTYLRSYKISGDSSKALNNLIVTNETLDYNPAVGARDDGRRTTLYSPGRIGQTRVEAKAVTGRSPKPAAGRVAATKGGSQQMNRIPVSSQGITEVGYHEEADSRGTLELKFSNGGVYEFFNVPTKMYDEFMHAPSRDDYYRANIGKRFPCTRVG
jgi:KTSC domain